MIQTYDVSVGLCCSQKKNKKNMDFPPTDPYRSKIGADLAQVAHHLGGVVVEVVRHVRQRNLAAVQILEGHVHLEPTAALYL